MERGKGQGKAVGEGGGQEGCAEKAERWRGWGERAHMCLKNCKAVWPRERTLRRGCRAGVEGTD